MKRRIQLLTFCLVFATQPTDASNVQVCSGIQFSNPIKPELDAVEKRLICGDSASQFEAWRTIPLSQAQFHLKTFLQSRGYNSARFEIKGDKMFVQIGDPTRIRELRVHEAPPELDVTRRRHVIDAVLTPEKLNDFEGWSRQKLMERGYPCPEIRTQANSISGVVDVFAHEGLQQNFGKVIEEPSLLKSGILGRYYAFHSGQLYDERLTAITSRRAVNEGIVQNLRFEPKCGTGGLLLTQSVVTGPPRLFTFGFGFNTEELFVVRSSWKHSRLFDMASLFDVTLLASLRSQELETSMKWYVLNQPSRFYLRPVFSVRREKEPGKYETVSIGVKFLPSYDHDFENVFVRAAAGPSLQQTDLIEGVGPDVSHLLLFETETEILSHNFEYYRGEPQQGAQLALQTAHMAKDAISQTSATQFRLTGQWLENHKDFEPPLLVAGLRFGVSSTLAESQESVVTFLPPQFRYFLGGLSNVRGFSRQELPHHGTGGLTSVFAGLELRSTAVLWQNFQPYAFLDLGMLGDQSLSLNQDLFWSPGLGFRWNSPVGVFRLNLAHGFVSNRQPSTPEGVSHWQFYLAYGEEF
jgi:translocation and assembly module TamA